MFKVVVVDLFDRVCGPLGRLSATNPSCKRSGRFGSGWGKGGGGGGETCVGEGGPSVRTWTRHRLQPTERIGTRTKLRKVAAGGASHSLCTVLMRYL